MVEGVLGDEAAELNRGFLPAGQRRPAAVHAQARHLPRRPASPPAAATANGSPPRPAATPTCCGRSQMRCWWARRRRWPTIQRSPAGFPAWPRAHRCGWWQTAGCGCRPKRGSSHRPRATDLGTDHGCRRSRPASGAGAAGVVVINAATDSTNVPEYRVDGAGAGQARLGARGLIEGGGRLPPRSCAPPGRPPVLVHRAEDHRRRRPCCGCRPRPHDGGVGAGLPAAADARARQRYPLRIRSLTTRRDDRPACRDRRLPRWRKRRLGVC